MNAAVISFGIIVSVMTLSGSVLLITEHDVAGWVLIAFSIFNALALLSMIVSTGVSRPSVFGRTPTP